MNTKIAAALCSIVAVFGLSAGAASAATPDLGGHVTFKNVVTEQHCYRTVVTTYRLYAGSYWAPVRTATTYHLSQCGGFGGYLSHR